MADTKLTELTELSVPALDDWLYWVDKSDTTDDAAGSSRKASITRGLGFLNQLCQYRLTLVSGNPHHTFNQPITPSATSAGADTVDFASAHGWQTGVIVTAQVTGNGLTHGTKYYVRAVDTDTISFHTTFADADANTNLVNLTGSVTSPIMPIGLAGKTIYFTPYNGNLLSLYDGTRWRLYAPGEISLAIGTLTADKNYDVFVYDNAGTVTLELSAAWTNDTARADALVAQDGVWVKSGATTRRYVGTFRTESTVALADSVGGCGYGGRRWLWNLYNHVRRTVNAFEFTSSWTYTTATYRQARASTENQVDVVCGISGASNIDAMLHVRANNSSASIPIRVAIGGEDSTTAPAAECAVLRDQGSAASTDDMNGICRMTKNVPLGRHFYAWLEYSTATGTCTWVGSDAASPTVVRSGITGSYEC